MLTRNIDNVVVSDIAYHIQEIQNLLGIQSTVSNENTPYRVAKMYANELFLNRNDDYLSELKENVERALYPTTNCYEVVIRDIPFHSTCFTGKTPIRTVNGVKYIKDVKVGDKVLTFTEKGYLEERKVLHTMKHKTRNTLLVHTLKGKKIRCTHDHPFYVENEGWVEAINLVKGDTLRTLNKGKDFNKSKTWDFTINEGYDYGYVLGALASDGSIWRNQIRLEVNDEDFANTFSKSLNNAFNLNSVVTKTSYTSGFTPEKYPNRFLVRVISGYLVDYFNKVFGGSTGSKEFKLPKTIFNSFDSFKGFINGYFDGDGSYNKSSGACLITSNNDFANELSKVLNTYCHTRDNIYAFGVPLHLLDLHKREIFKERFDKYFQDELLNTIKFEVNPLIDFDEVLDVELLPEKLVNVYNFEVEENHTYLANDIWVHNCEHHWLPFSGKVSIQYKPRKSIIGLSKVPRVVKYFSQKPQLQEQLTGDICNFLAEILEPEFLFVTIEATHSCVACRGAESDCITTTESNFYYRGDE